MVSDGTDSRAGCPADTQPTARRAAARWLAFGAVLVALTCPLRAAEGALRMRDGYFWDPLTADYFIPRGIAYQTWNPPVGADQTFAQLDYDLVEIRKLHANSVRCEIVWNQVEKTPGVFDWSKPDHLVAQAEALGLKLFVLIGFNYAPDWFPVDWRAVGSDGLPSVVLNYEHPEVRQAYSNYIAQVATRYRNSTAIGGWILGNEYAYFDLWNPGSVHLGYDAFSQAAFRSWLQKRYAGSIAALNATWGTTFTSFDTVVMPPTFPPDRNDPGYHDLAQWREYSIGEYVAVGATAARLADPTRLRTYSMLGGIFSGNDANYTYESAARIVERCAAAGAPLDFWSINDYAWASFDMEMRSADFGVAKYQALSGLPVMVSEIGFTSTENHFAGAPERQATALASQIWEPLVSGAIGVHLFTWTDRELYGGFFIRERGFGILRQDRVPKQPVFDNVSEAFRRLEQLHPERLLGGSRNPPSDIAVLWPDACVIGWPRANQETAMLWGALRRIGYQPGIVSEPQFEAGLGPAVRAMLLPRCYKLRPEDLARLQTAVIPRGIHIHANADLPGQFDPYHHPNPAWPGTMAALFGLDVSTAVAALDSGVTNSPMSSLTFKGVHPLGPLAPGATDTIATWKIWHGVRTTGGVTLATHTGQDGTQPPLPALHTRDLGTARTAVNTFALGDLSRHLSIHAWDVRYDWLHTIYRAWFDVAPVINLTGPGSRYVMPDYRPCASNTVLLSLLNQHTNPAVVTVEAPTLTTGRVAEDLTRGGRIPLNPDGTLTVPLAGDELVLLYLYARQPAQDESLINPFPDKLWFDAAPNAVWPRPSGASVEVGFDLVANGELFVALEAVHAAHQSYAVAGPYAVAGRTNQSVIVPIPEARLEDPFYRSSTEGGEYRFRAWIEHGGNRTAEVSLPVRLLWGVRPLELPNPSSLTPDSMHAVTVAWEELPSYVETDDGTPLDRAGLWQEYLAGQRHFEIVLELQRADGTPAVRQSVVTASGSGEHTFAIQVPRTPAGPWRWLAYARPAPEASVDFTDGFENRGPGEGADLLKPWNAYVYSQNGTAAYLNGGVQTAGFCCDQSGFLVVTNPPTVGAWSGFGLRYDCPQPWALPLDPTQWKHYRLGFDFREDHRQPCTLELQLLDSCGGLAVVTRAYAPGPDGWDRFEATLDQLIVPSYASGFNPSLLSSLVVNIQAPAAALYVASFDNIQLDGPETAPPAGASPTLHESFETRCLGDGGDLTQPWTGYVYGESGQVGFLAQGIHPTASEGTRAAFLMAGNQEQAGNLATFGFTRTFPEPWALPADRAAWAAYRFSCDMRENQRKPGILKLRLKSGPNAWIEFVKIYAPGIEGWDTVAAPLDQFVQGFGIDAFDPTHVESLVVEFRMMQTGGTYLGSFDRIRFDAPATPLPPELGYATFHSANDLPDRDRDGIPDAYETGTGVYLDPTHTGTRPDRPDSDGDGASDWQECVAGTNPNVGGDALQLEVLAKGSQVSLHWSARAGRAYDVLSASELGAIFLPVPGLQNLTAAADESWTLPLPAAGEASRYYRLQVRWP
jgi:hypothetical protein